MAGIASMVDLIFFVCSLSSLYYPAVYSHRDLILYAITVGKITAVQAPCYIYRRQNYKHNSNFILKTFANLIEPKMWPLCMARNGGPSVDVRIHSSPGPTVDLQLARANCGCRAIHSQANCRSTVGPEQMCWEVCLYSYCLGARLHTLRRGS